MTKATLEFNLPEEQEEFLIACSAGAAAAAVWDFDQWLRNMVKHGAEPLDQETVSKVRDQLNLCFSEREVKIG